MQHVLSAATWFWLVVPMTTVMVLAIISYVLSLLNSDGGDQ